METKIRKWGNSLGLRVTKAHAGDLGWTDGVVVDLTVDGDQLVVRSAARAAFRLLDLVTEISEYNMHSRSDAPGAPPPDRGDLIWLDGSGEGERRPALVLSPAVYNARVGLALVCPVATRIKGYPFEVVLKVGGRTVGAVLADQVETVDWRTRRIERIDEAPPAVVREVAARLAALTG